MTEDAKLAAVNAAVAQDPEEGPDVVSVMTVHGSKGLEFRYVFVINLVEQRFPSVGRSSSIDFPAGLVSISNGTDDHLAEERRLFYVAMTRAKEGLYLLSADDYGGARKRKMSRFLAEIGFDPSVGRALCRSCKARAACNGQEREKRAVFAPLF